MAKMFLGNWYTWCFQHMSCNDSIFCRGHLKQIKSWGLDKMVSHHCHEPFKNSNDSTWSIMLKQSMPPGLSATNPPKIDDNTETQIVDVMAVDLSSVGESLPLTTSVPTASLRSSYQKGTSLTETLPLQTPAETTPAANVKAMRFDIFLETRLAWTKQILYNLEKMYWQNFFAKKDMQYKHNTAHRSLLSF